MMARITVQSLTTAGLVPAFTNVSSAGGDEFVNDGHTILYVKMTSTAGIVWDSGVVFAVPTTNAVSVASQLSPVPKGLVAVNVTVEVSALGEKMGGFFDPGAYNDSSGCVQMTYTTPVGLSVAAISVT